VTPPDPSGETGGELARALAALYARVPLGMRLGLEPMREACAAAGHPERAFEAVHVAGTNGKGSVCAMVESIARAHGLRTGLYTSPHLCRFAERIRIDGEPIDDARLAPLLLEVVDRTPGLSFFETATLAAFVAFREAKVDLAVIEVGIGGRLDATNVLLAPRAAAITRIALDHMDRLGPTLADIAREKAGIAKPGMDLVLGPIEGDALRTILGVAQANGARTTLASSDPEAVGFAGSAAIGLAGAHQRDNAAIAYLLGARIGASREARTHGIASVSWPGRLETIADEGGPVLLDAAHNPDGALSLAHHLGSSGRSPERSALVFGTLADKDWATMLGTLAPCADHRFYVRPQGRTPTPPSSLAALAPGACAGSLDEALASARRAVGPAGLVVVAGSIFLVGEARALLLGLARDPAVAL
jgi:dihydrofolate synthase/folylpolyglutamate synthase